MNAVPKKAMVELSVPEPVAVTVDPSTVRMKQRIAAKKFRINGVDLLPADKTIEWGKKIVDYRAERTVEAIRAALGK